MRVLVFGAGVIGRIYAGRLLAAGYQVSMVCHAEAAHEIDTNGTLLRRGGRSAEPEHPSVFLRAADAGTVDIALIATRRDQVDDALPALRQIKADTIVSLIDLPLGLEDLSKAVGANRYVAAFPGVAGKIGSDGVVDYLQVDQQPTTIGSSPQASVVAALLNSAGFPTAVTSNMSAWLATHAVFVSAFESSIVSAGGDAAALANDPVAMRSLVLAVREGLRALHAIDVPVLPASVRLIFLSMPVWFGVRYWSHALAGPLGALGMAPHSRASHATELPALQDDVRVILKGRRVPRLEGIFAESVAAAAGRGPIDAASAARTAVAL